MSEFIKRTVQLFSVVRLLVANGLSITNTRQLPITRSIIVVPMDNDTNKDEPHIPWSLLVTVLVLCIVLVLVLPVMGVAYMDMNNATARAMEEVKKMRELRAKIMMEMQGE